MRVRAAYSAARRFYEQAEASLLKRIPALLAERPQAMRVADQVAGTRSQLARLRAALSSTLHDVDGFAAVHAGELKARTSRDGKKAAKRQARELSTFLEDVRAQPEGNECGDCGAARPQWGSVNLGLLLCSECARLHQTELSAASYHALVGGATEGAADRSSWLVSRVFPVAPGITHRALPRPCDLMILRVLGNAGANSVLEHKLRARPKLLECVLPWLCATVLLVPLIAVRVGL